MSPAYTVKICLTLRVDKDADVIEALEKAPNKTELVRQAIRAQMHKEAEDEDSTIDNV